MDDWGSISDFLNSRMNYFVGVYFEPNPEKNLHLRLENRLSMSFLYTDETIFQEVLQGALNFWAQTEQAERYELTTTSLAQLDLKSNIHQFALSQNASPGTFSVFLRLKEPEKEQLDLLLKEVIENPNSTASGQAFQNDMPIDPQQKRKRTLTQSSWLISHVSNGFVILPSTSLSKTARKGSSTCSQTLTACST